MPDSQNQYRIFLEVGKKKVFAGAVDWPGWCRWGKDEAGAMQRLLAYGPRYARVVASADVGFAAPREVSAFEVVERVVGNATTDFGAPNMPLAGDEAPLNEEEIERLARVLKAIWDALDDMLEQAQGKALRKGPRGGGRELDAILNHVVEADRSYLSTLGWPVKRAKAEDDRQLLARVRQGAIDGLRAAAAGALPTEGPRGGKRWSPRQFVRRLAWHELDHVWEIEDRAIDDR